MFTQISWSSYITIVVVVLAGYYLFIAVKFYRNDFLQLLHFTTGENPVSEKLAGPGAEDKFSLMEQSLCDDIKAYVREAGRNKSNHEDVMKTFRLILAKYPAIKASPYRTTIENVIITEIEANFSIQVSAEESAALWP